MGNSPIVARINSLLAEKGISKQVFYRDCNITSASYSLWNTGKTMPRMKNIEVIAAYLHTTTDYLLTGLGEKEKAPTQEGERDEIIVNPAYFRVMKDAQEKGIPAEDIQAIIDFLERSRRRDQG